MLAAALLAGCGTEAIVVSEAAVTDRPEAQVTGFTASEEPKLVFFPEDEKVVLKLLFEFNYRAVYEWYKVEWIAPSGEPYKVVSLRTDFGSHRVLTADLGIRGKMASRMPGVWQARIWLLGREGAPDRLLVSRLFRIAEPTPQMLVAGLTPVDPPPAAAERPLAGAASGSAPAPEPAAAPQSDEDRVLPPLALGAAVPAAGVPAAEGVPPPAAGVPAPGAPTSSAEGVSPPAAQHGVVSVTMTATRGAEEPDRAARSSGGQYALCPPLWYPPTPGCVEQAPQE